MKHPTTELAEYLDGTLPAEARAVVAAHLDACTTCAEEMRAAEAARIVLRTQPAIVAPPAVGMEAIAEARAAAAALHTRHEAARWAPHQAWSRWAAVAGVAAGILLLAVIVLPNVGGGDRGGTLTADAEYDAAAMTPAAAVEVIDGDLDIAAIQRLAQGYRVEEAAGAEGPVAGSTESLTVTEVNDSPAAVDEAVACLERAFGPLPAPPARLLEARVDGEPAVLGVVVTGPGAGQPPDTAEVYVARRPACTILSSTRAEL
jgi:hypothetical protein